MTEAAVGATLRWIGGACPGSRLVFTYVHRRVLEDSRPFQGTDRLFRTLRSAGETWTFGLDPSEVAAFLLALGLVLDEDVGAADYRALCFGDESASMGGYEFYRIAVAHVHGGSSTSVDPRTLR